MTSSERTRRKNATAYSREWRAKHRDRLRVRAAELRALHHEKELARSRAYYAANRDMLVQKACERDKTHPRVMLGGHRTYVPGLPPDLRPIALLIREARKEIRAGGKRV